ncbi:MAG: pyruvate, phosphate dikinase, partial [Deltaproteobacteria bacterium]|nr:pyruvate, phosphate dikinase [Deltaproteobacteria bacterium]
IRTPQPINKEGGASDLPSLQEVMPESYDQLVKIKDLLEKHYRDMQDIEFTIEKKKLFMLQTRNGKRTARAAIKVAVDMVKEGLISEKEAVLRVSPSQLGQLLHPSLDPKAPKEVIAKGLPASPGAASGAIVFSAEDAEAAAAEKRKVVLVRLETSPEDIHGMDAAQGILTARGGMTSHAAVVTRGMGKCCVVGCSDIKVDYQKKQFSNRQGEIFKEGDIITLNGSTGEVMRGAVPTIQPDITGDFATLMGWVDKYKKLGVRANADTPKDARVARNFGADGIGLVRTEHMFFQGERIRAMREMIMAEDIEGRQKALAKILPMQRQDYYDIFIEMKDLPVMIRLLDPPLNEFLPQEEREMAELAEIMGMPLAKVKAIAEHLHENNPMLGHRGCRLGMTFPEIYDMQVQAIIEAACELTRDKGFNVVPEIMMPLVATYNEMHLLKERADKVAAEVMERLGVKIKYMVGACVELPRTCLIADRIAEDAEFFSFGTNDLTQTTYGLSRDDSGDFLPFYVEHNLYEHNPFISIDQTGVGEMVKIGCERGRKTRPNLKIGICGEHGGEPESIKFFHRIGLNYVSCSPFRVPVARLAAAHGALEEEMKKG